MRFGNNKLNRILAVALCATTLTGGFLPTVSVEAAVRSGQHSEVRQGRGDNQQHKRTDPGNKTGHTAPAQKNNKNRQPDRQTQDKHRDEQNRHQEQQRKEHEQRQKQEKHRQEEMKRQEQHRREQEQHRKEQEHKRQEQEKRRAEENRREEVRRHEEQRREKDHRQEEAHREAERRHHEEEMRRREHWRYHDYDDYRHDNKTGEAILGGIIGALIIGAILQNTSASHHNSKYSNVMSTDYEPAEEETEEILL